MSFHVQWELTLVLHMVDADEFAKYDSRTRTTLAYVADYRDAISYMDWQLDVQKLPLSKISTCISRRQRGLGACCWFSACRYTPITLPSFANNVLAYDMNRPTGTAFLPQNHVGREHKHKYALDTCR